VSKSICCSLLLLLVLVLVEQMQMQMQMQMRIWIWTPYSIQPLIRSKGRKDVPVLKPWGFISLYQFLTSVVLCGIVSYRTLSHRIEADGATQVLLRLLVVSEDRFWCFRWDLWFFVRLLCINLSVTRAASVMLL